MSPRPEHRTETEIETETVGLAAPLVLALLVGIGLTAAARAVVSPRVGAGFDLTADTPAAAAARYVMNDFCLGIAALGLSGLVYAGLLLWGGRWERRLLAQGGPDAVPAVVAYITGSLREPRSLVGTTMADTADPMMRAADAADHWETLRARRAIPLGLVVWALPLLGFIGTVIGISQAIGGLGAVFEASAREAALSDVLSALRFAFDTTFVGLASVLPTMVAMQVLRASSDSARRVLLRRVTQTYGAV